MKTQIDASEVLEEILKRLSILEKEISTNNFLLKTLLAKKDVVNLKPAEDLSAKKKFPVIESNIIPKEVIVNQPIVKLDPGKIPEQKQIEQIKQKPLTEEKFAVVQKVSQGEKSVVLANVIVLNSIGKIAYEGMTTISGQWSAPLSAGDYSVSIKRAGGVGMSEVDITNNFNISASKIKDGKIILPPIKI